MWWFSCWITRPVSTQPCQLAVPCAWQRRRGGYFLRRRSHWATVLSTRWITTSSSLSLLARLPAVSSYNALPNSSFIPHRWQPFHWMLIANRSWLWGFFGMARQWRSTLVWASGGGGWPHHGGHWSCSRGGSLAQYSQTVVALSSACTGIDSWRGDYSNVFVVTIIIIIIIIIIVIIIVVVIWSNQWSTAAWTTASAAATTAASHSFLLSLWPGSWPYYSTTASQTHANHPHHNHNHRWDITITRYLHPSSITKCWLDAWSHSLRTTTAITTMKQSQ